MKTRQNDLFGLGLVPKCLNRERYDAVWLAIASLVLYLWRLGQVPLRDWDEATIAMVAREMLNSGQWLHPTLYGDPYWNKPPLLEWLMASAFAVGGIGDWTARFLPALIAASAVPLLYWLGRELFGDRQTAWMSAWVYLALLPVARHGRLAMRDGVAITLFLVLSVAVLKARQNHRWTVLAGLAFGGLMLAKGILALLLAGIVLVFLVAEGQWKLLQSGYAWVGMAIGCVPAIAWYALQLQHYGVVFWQVHFLSQSFDRVWSVVESNQGPPWYYLLEILKYGGPWLIFLPGGWWLAWKHRHQDWAKWIGLGTVLYLGTISVMGTKLPWYVMPVYSFVALAVGTQVSVLIDDKLIPRWIAKILACMGVILLLGGVTYGAIEREPTIVAIAMILSLTFGWTAKEVFADRSTFFTPLLVGLYCGLLVLFHSDLWVWELNEAYPVKPVAQLVRSRTPPDAEILTSFGYVRPSLDFYSTRRILPIAPTAISDRWQTGTYFLVEDVDVLPSHQNLGSAEGFTLVTPNPN